MGTSRSNIQELIGKALVIPDAEIGPAATNLKVPPTIDVSHEYREAYSDGYRHAITDVRKYLLKTPWEFVIVNSEGIIRDKSSQIELTRMTDTSAGPIILEALNRMAARFTCKTRSRTVQTTQQCLYTQALTCRVAYPHDIEQWCGFCSGTHKAEQL